MMTPQRWLRLHFGRNPHPNAQLNPPLTEPVRRFAESEEDFAVSVVSKTEARYWLTDRRIILEESGVVTLLFSYNEVNRVHWMFKGWLVNATSPEEISQTKQQYFDRLEVELADGRIVIMEGLDQSYLCIYEFLRRFPIKERHGALLKK